MAHAFHHGGGQKSALSKRYRGEHPDATPRTESIRAFIQRQMVTTGHIPTAAEVAAAFAMSLDKVERHYRVLGLL
jgi:hypothetical protein